MKEKELVVCKFGGSSVQNPTQIKKITQIVKEDNTRKVVVVSAPGRDETYNQKITDHLLNCATKGKYFSEQKIDISHEQSFEKIMGKFEYLCTGLDISPKGIVDALKKDLNNCSLNDEKRIAYFLSRGEHYNAKLIALYFKASGLNVELKLPEEFGFMLSEDYLNAKVLEPSYENIKKSFDFKEDTIYVVPGFYGITQNKELAVLSRGGSDLTGGELS
ncbi:MAG: aspartate kinase, partial [Arcobacteraceae bacterium]|nr:aspartate kinase [Arcobacteraceae bacterium]